MSIIRTLPIPVVIVALGFLLAMAGILFYGAWFARRRAALMTDIPVSPLATAAPGYRQVMGRAEAVDGQDVRADLTRWSCVWFSATVERMEFSDDQQLRQHSGWVTVSEETSRSLFVVRDETGAATVHPGGADVTPTDRSVWYGATPKPENRDPPRLKMTEDPGVTVDIGNASSRRYRYTERRIYAGDPLVVLGQLAGSVAQSTANITRGAGKDRPFVVAAATRNQHVGLYDQAVIGALFVALFPLGLAALLIWIRFF